MASKKSFEVNPVVEPAALAKAGDAARADASETIKAVTAEIVAAESAGAKAVDEAVAASKSLLPTSNTETKASMEKVMKTAEEMVSFGQGNLEAFAKSSQIWAAGVQDLSKQVAATAQAQMEQTVATMKALAGVRSLKEAIDLQSNLARVSVEKAMTETGKLTDASMKLAEQAFAPITARVTLAMEKFGRAV